MRSSDPQTIFMLDSFFGICLNFCHFSDNISWSILCLACHIITIHVMWFHAHSSHGLRLQFIHTSIILTYSRRDISPDQIWLETSRRRLTCLEEFFLCKYLAPLGHTRSSGLGFEFQHFSLQPLHSMLDRSYNSDVVVPVKCSAGLTIWQKRHMPRAPRFWGPRAFGGPALLGAPRFWGPRAFGGPALLGAPRFWGPRAFGGPALLGAPRFWGPRASLFYFFLNFFVSARGPNSAPERGPKEPKSPRKLEAPKNRPQTFSFCSLL